MNKKVDIPLEDLLYICILRYLYSSHNDIFELIDLPNYMSYTKAKGGLLMKIHELHQELLLISNSEQAHIQHPGMLSPRYKKLKKTTLHNQDHYIFSFDSLLKDHNIFIYKESRFTNIPLHIHTNIEISYAYQGECTQIINGRNIHMKEGDICILDTNVPHEILPLQEHDILITIGMRKQYFSNSFLTRLSSKGIVSSFLANAITENTDHKQFLLFYPEQKEQIHMTIVQLMCEYFDKTACSDEIIDSYMTILFSQLLRTYRKNCYEQSDPLGKETQLLSILQYLEQNFREVSLSSCAQHFGFHPTYMSNYLKAKTGKTFKELIILQRMSLASFYLCNSDRPIYEISEDIGYDNLGFFYRKFRAIFHVNPQEYRNLNKN